MFNHPEHNAFSFINIMISAFNIISSIQNHHRHSKSPAVFKIFIIINILMIGNLVQLNFVLNHPEPNSIPAKCILINVINTVTSIIRIQNSQMAIQNSQLHGKGGQCQLIKLSKICHVANHSCSFTKNVANYRAALSQRPSVLRTSFVSFYAGDISTSLQLQPLFEINSNYHIMCFS